MKSFYASFAVVLMAWASGPTVAAQSPAPASSQTAPQVTAPPPVRPAGQSQAPAGAPVPRPPVVLGPIIATGTNATGAYVSAQSTGNPLVFIGSDPNPYGIVGTFSPHPLGLRTNNVLRMFLDTAGNVGIGTTGPAFKLEVVDPFSTGLRVQTNAPGGTVASFGGYGDFQVDAAGVAGGRLTVKEGGNVGIGTASPAQKLTVAGTVQSTSGGFKFPDGSVQTTAASPTYTTTNIGGTIAPPNSPLGSIGHLNLPTGTYMLSATVEFANDANYFAQDNTRTVYCGFSGDRNLFGVDMLYDFFIAGSRRLTGTLHSVLNISSGRVDIYCRVLDGNATVSDVFVQTGRARLTAVKIEGNVYVQ